MNDFMYKSYKTARDKAWETLIDCNIDSLPVNLNKICKKLDIKTTPYSKFALLDLFKPEVVSTDGFTFNFYDNKFIVYNDSSSIQRQRFTVAHEIGHIVLGHKSDMVYYRNYTSSKKNKNQENQANTFARNLLMPATVLSALELTTPDEIASVCQVSYDAAQYRLKRLNILNQRNMFNIHPLENNVYNNFYNYILNFQKK